MNSSFPVLHERLFSFSSESFRVKKRLHPVKICQIRLWHERLKDTKDFDASPKGNFPARTAGKIFTQSSWGMRKPNVTKGEHT